MARKGPPCLHPHPHSLASALGLHILSAAFYSVELCQRGHYAGHDILTHLIYLMRNSLSLQIIGWAMQEVSPTITLCICP